METYVTPHQYGLPRPSGTVPMRTPRDVMRHREAKEARKRAEALKSMGQGQGLGQTEPSAHIIDTSSRFLESTPVVASSARPYRDRIDHGDERVTAPQSSSDMLTASQELLNHTQGQVRPRPAETDPQDQRRAAAQASRPMAPSGAAAAAAAAAVNARSADKTRGAASSFPQAFERWENLSAHWEGLTSYWLHKLDANREALEYSDTSTVIATTDMSRQITDLSAAGANLFHAVVELQRLRASSERKFQRWFLELKQEQEVIKDSKAALERKLHSERAARAKDKAMLSRTEVDRSLAEKRVSELTRELFINKEEARRAWEELGRREVEERDRTISLRAGLPTVVGGVQVVPMHATGSVSHQGSTGQRPSTTESRQPVAAEGLLGVPTSPTGTDPFTEANRHFEPRPMTGEQSAGHGEVTHEAHGFARPPTRGHATESLASAMPSSMYQQYTMSADDLASGQRPGGPATDTPWYHEVSATDNDGHLTADAHQLGDVREMRDGAPDVRGGRGSSHHPAPAGEEEREDSRDEYADDDEADWSDSGDDRHHHPTRLSDVIEEDESRPRSKRSSGLSRP